MSTKKSRCYTNFHTFIYKLLKTHDTTTNITGESKDILNGIIQDLAFKYVTASALITKHAKRITIDFNAIETLTKVWLKGTDNIIHFANTMWDNYLKNTTKNIKKYERAGLTLPPSRIYETFKEYKLSNQKIGESSYVYLTAIIEYIISMILTEAIILAHQDNKITITGLHIYNAIHSAQMSNFRPLFKDTFFAGFGYADNKLLLESQQKYVTKHKNDFVKN